MQTLEIIVPDNKSRLVKGFLKELGVTIKVKKKINIPNADTIAAMDELKAGKGKKFKSVDEQRHNRFKINLTTPRSF